MFGQATSQIVIASYHNLKDVGSAIVVPVAVVSAAHVMGYCTVHAEGRHFI